MHVGIRHPAKSRSHPRLVAADPPVVERGAETPDAVGHVKHHAAPVGSRVGLYPQTHGQTPQKSYVIVGRALAGQLVEHRHRLRHEVKRLRVRLAAAKHYPQHLRQKHRHSLLYRRRNNPVHRSQRPD